MNKLTTVIIASLFSVSTGFAAEVTVTIHSTKADNKKLGTVVFSDTANGLLITPHLKDLPPGPHGFHLHQKPDCSDEGKAAGGHFDPNKSSSHAGPYSRGHLGDLPVLYVDSDGKATTPILAPRLKTSNLNNRAVVIHAGSDTYSDTPKLGGGGDRIACGMIKTTD